MTSTRHDVLVLGGGAAGLAAATVLVARGLDVALLEARSRFGGRMWTLREAGGVSVELGAEFVHGDAPRTVAIAREEQIDLENVRSAQRWDRRGALVEAPDLDRSLHGAVEAAARAGQQGPDRSFVEALGEAGVGEPGRRLALEYVQSLQAAEADRISARALATGDIGDQHTRRVVGGYERIVQALVGRLPGAVASRNQVVQSLRWERHSVEVLAGPASGSAPGRTFRARCAVVTLPLGVLRELPLSPALSRFESKTRALDGLASGHAVRVVLRFRDAFWRPRMPAPAFIHLPGAVWPVFWTGPGPDSPLLVAWAGGPMARRLESSEPGPGGLVDRALEVLSRAFEIPRSDVERGLTGTWTHDWTRDPFSHGAYSYPLVGGADAARSLAAPLDETLFFAGEATSEPPANGTVEGALESGYRAADEVLRAMGRS